MENNFDYVDFYDGPTTNSRRLTRITGAGPRDDVDASTNYTLLRFHTDGSVVRTGFNITFSASKKLFYLMDFEAFVLQVFSTNIFETRNFDVILGTCQGQRHFNGSSGSIVSPGYPTFNYPSNFDCVYTVTTPIGTTMAIYIDYLDVRDNAPRTLTYACIFAFNSFKMS